MNKNQYRQAPVDVIAPDAVIYIDGSRTISLKGFDDKNNDTNVAVDFMMFVNSISVSKGVDSVPGQATITVRSPRHMFEGFYGSIKDALSTMVEIEIYMKGRFLLEGEPQYYPTFWGMISNLSESTSAGDFVSVTITCQDMMRWLQVTKVNVQPSAYNSGIPIDINGQVLSKGMIAFSSYFVSLSMPGVINALLTLSTGDGFLELLNLADRDKAFDKAINEISQQSSTDADKIDTLRKFTDQTIKKWNEKFKEISSALYIFAYQGPGEINVNGVRDIIVDLNQYKYIYGMRKVTNAKTHLEVEQPWIDVSKLYPKGAAEFNAQEAPIFESNLQNRLDVANEVKDQLHFEFYQDVDGTIVLKPQFYNMDTRENPVYVIEDIDIESINEIDDESAVITRVDVTGVTVTGQNNTGGGDDANAYYGFAIDKDKLQKYGLRSEVIKTNFITSQDEAFQYAHRELARRNSLVDNTSLTIQGRPELKLGYPVFIRSKDMFGYITAIDHDFTFGETFSTRLSLTAIRKRKINNFGQILKNLLIEVTGTDSVQTNIIGKDTIHDQDNPLNNVATLCNPSSISKFAVERPDYRFKSIDDILKYQGTFRYIYDEAKQQGYDPRLFQQVTDNEGYELKGNGYPFAKDLKLSEDLKIIIKSSTGTSGAEIASSMTLSTTTGEQNSIRFQQPLTLDQIENVSIISNRSKSVIAAKMTPSSQSSDVVKLQTNKEP
jgi:hypothetical protein